MSCARSLSAQALRPALASSSATATTSAAAVFATRGLRTRAGRPAGNNEDGTPAVSMRTIEKMPFQTFQLALEVIKKDREEKLEEIKRQRIRIQNARNQEKEGLKRDRTLHSMEEHLEWLKIQADINNPRVKYNFDRGIIGMNKPVYRFLMDRKWREYRRPVLMQRLTQMHIVPDLLPHIDPVVDVQVRFSGRDVAPGTIVNSLQSERAPTFKIIPFKPGTIYCTVAVVDPDVPNLEKDGFDYKLHWLVSNIEISPSQTQALGVGAKPSDTIVKYLPPHVQKGIPYHRYGMIVFQQPGKIDAAALRAQGIQREGFNLRSFQAKQKLEAIGAYMWRAQWDENMKDVMIRNNLPGWDQMFVRRKDFI